MHAIFIIGLHQLRDIKGENKIQKVTLFDFQLTYLQIMMKNKYFVTCKLVGFLAITNL